MSDNFYENFGPIWEGLLSFEINQYREAMKYFGNANTYFILQVIAWHNLYVIQRREKNETYETLKRQWSNSKFEFENTIPDKLSVLTASQISGIDEETTGRAVKSLASDKWII